MFFKVKLLSLITKIAAWFTVQYYVIPFYRREFSGRCDNEYLIFDVGAHRGESINAFRKVFKNCKLWSFEPNKKLCNELKLKFRNHPNNVIENLGVSDVTGDQEFFVGLIDTNSSLSSAVLRTDSITSKIFGLTPKKMFPERYVIETVTLDDYLKRVNIPKIDILKIDVEGHELSVLQGLKETLKSSFKIDYIQMENVLYSEHYSNRDVNQAVDFLVDNNYEVIHRFKHVSPKIEEIIFRSL